MPHARETVRKAFVAAVTGLTTTGSSVFTSRVRALRDEDLPSLSVYVARNAETVTDDGEMGPYQLRVLSIEVEAREKVTSGIDDALDDICVEVETALMTDSALKALIKEHILVSTEIELDADGEQPVGIARMEWAIVYRVNGAAPTAPVQ